MPYNGWRNRATWNVALWHNNDEPLYRKKLDFLRHNAPTADAVQLFVLTWFHNPDRVDLKEVDWDEIAASWAEDVPGDRP